jgi:hypothetical protein
MTDGQSAVCLSVRHPSGAHDQILITVSAGLLMRGALSGERTSLELQLLLGLTSAVILGSESRRTHDHILLSRIRERARAPHLYSPGTGWPSYTPRQWVSLVL